MVFKNTIYSILWEFEKENEKNIKIFQKISKKVLTNENIYDILHERSTEGRKKQRSLKIEQQQRMNELRSR